MTSECSVTDAPFLGDNLALDFINSEYMVDGQRQDSLTSEQSVVSWLERAGVLHNINQQLPEGLLAEAREFRDTARMIVHAAMNSIPVDLTVINRVLLTGQPVTKLEWDGDMQQFRTAVNQTSDSPSGLLWPVADALVSLVTSDKFRFVRQCEADDCILLFHDLSKSHRRRWCSMATCGNRMKVAAFRSRKKPV
ncbi:CGNR zinc finger domain-containing protein [Tatumella citrea]|uniref:Zinc finger CGNR domain-containing protein n=1 Tax=Tatumella citrea TaxID=53336 RepID=A0A1Y0LG89_TATCI|nr:ABATE domain-containing protein [Tatumella citrea]ARU92633.1 hypothetical protein A7K98_01795 [Tatumella citrea]ARU96669.1 hypothetical protein A7K99_01795 [Tatumella citrea]